VPSLLWTSYRRYLAANPWLLLLSLCAIATGVAVILGIDVASISARRSFALSTEAMTGQATHSIVGSGHTVPDQLYRQLRVDWGYRRCAPVVDGYVRFPQDSEEQQATTLTLLGVDLLADGSIRQWTVSQQRGDPGRGDHRLGRLLGSADQVVASASTARKLGWKVGQKRRAEAGGRPLDLVLAGVFEPATAAAANALDNLLVADIATAQSILGQSGLDRIDLVLTEAQQQQLRGKLPSGLVLQPAGTSQRTAAELSAAFHLSLQALSYLCLLVASFLIFNVVSFTVAHRRQSLGRLRVLGLSAAELRKLLMGEALAVGASASALGCVAGLGLGRALVPLVARTVNDLYYVQSITRFDVPASLLLKAFFCGLAATVLAAAFPAWQASRAEPLALLYRVPDRASARKGAKSSAAVGAACLLSAALLLLHPSLQAGFLCLLAVVVGYGLLVPLALLLSVCAGRNLCTKLSYRLGLEGLTAYLGRSGTAGMALTVAVAATVSIAMMVSSFRSTLTSWLETTLSADVYLTLHDKAAVAGGATLEGGAVQRALQLPQLRAWSGQRVVVLPSDTGETLLIGVRSGGEYHRSLRFLALAEHGWQRFEQGEGVFLTEPYSRRAKKSLGSTLTVSTPLGRRAFPVLGVYYSYAPDRNSALLGWSGFGALFGSDSYSGVGLYLRAGSDPSKTVSRLKAIFGEAVDVRATGELRRLALEIFERTFTVTRVLRLLALAVAIVGVLLSLMALAIEREAEVKVLRALGLRRSELFAVAVVQSAWLGAVTGLLACPLGVLLARVMIDVVNRRAFGWTISFVPDWGGLASSLGLGLSASLLAGLLPAWRWSRRRADEALRERE
jgi:putative ABC transport system permease protein